MFGWSSLGNGTKTAVGAVVGLAVVILLLLFLNGQGEPVVISTDAPEADGATSTTAEVAAPAGDAAPEASEVAEAMPDEPTSDGGATATVDATDQADTQTAEGVETPTTDQDATAETAEMDAAAETAEQTADADTPDAEIDTDDPDDTETAKATPLPPAPVFDLVRVEADGSALIAGRGEPGAVITLLLNGEEIARETVDGGGNFVSFATVPGSDEPQALSIRMSTSDNQVVTSTQTVMIAPASRSQPDQIAEAVPMPTAPEAPDAEAAAPVQTDNSEPAASQIAALDAPEQEGASDAVAASASDLSTKPNTGSAVGATETPASAAAPTVGEAPAPEQTTTDVAALATPPEPAAAAPDTDTSAPQVLIADSEGVRVLQPGGQGPDVLDVIALDTISYDDAGDVTLAGRGTGTGFVRVYIDNEPVKTLDITDDGRWSAPLPEVDTGIYTLRIDELNDDGQVVSRVETPFKREEPSVLAEAMAEQAATAGDVRVMTVQKGDTLWDISRVNYGQGIQYVRVFEANRDRIRDPHWIYPGQVFTLPDGTE